MAWIRALVIMPRSPTMTIWASPNLSRTTVTISVNAPGSPVLPGNTRTATGRPSGSVSSPYSICSFPFLPSREYQRAVPSLQPRAGQVEQRRLRRVDRRGQVPGREPGLDGVLPVHEPVHGGVDVIGGGVRDAEVGAQRGIGPPGQGGQLGGRGDDPGDDQGQGQVPVAARGAEQGGQAELPGHGVDGGGVAVRQGPGDGDRGGGGDHLLAFEAGVDQVDDMVWEGGEVGDGLVLDLAAVAVGAAQVGRGVVLAAALLVHVPGLGDSDYVNLPAVYRHSQIIKP